MTEQERNAAFTAKLPELVAVVKELHSLAKLSLPYQLECSVQQQAEGLPCCLFRTITPILIPDLAHTAIFTPKSKKCADISALIFDKGENENGKIL